MDKGQTGRPHEILGYGYPSFDDSRVISRKKGGELIVFTTDQGKVTELNRGLRLTA